MKRDWDVVRQILLDIESGVGEFTIQKTARIWPEDPLSHNLKLLIDAEFVTNVQWYSDGKPMISRARLTWAGSDFLDSIRIDSIWTRVKAYIRDKGVPATLPVIQNAAGSIIADVLK